MFELRVNAKGEKVLRYTERPQMSSEKGMWVEVCHEREKEATFYVETNRAQGLQVEKDERGMWRALVLKS